MKNVQVFTAGSEYCEVDGELLEIDQLGDYLYLKVRSEKKIWEYYFPSHNLAQVRISRE